MNRRLVCAPFSLFLSPTGVCSLSMNWRTTWGQLSRQSVPGTCRLLQHGGAHGIAWQGRCSTLDRSRSEDNWVGLTSSRRLSSFVGCLCNVGGASSQHRSANNERRL